MAISLGTLVKTSVVLGGAVAAFGYYTRYDISNKFTNQPYYVKSIALLEGYEPALEKLGKPVTYNKPDIADSFNYHDETIGRAKVPVNGNLRKAELMIHAYRANRHEEWWIDKLEISFKGSGLKYKFYDGAFNKPKNLDDNNKPIVEANAETEYIK